MNQWADSDVFFSVEPTNWVVNNKLYIYTIKFSKLLRTLWHSP